MESDVRTVEHLLDDLPYQGYRLDGIATLSERLQLSSHICVFERNLLTYRTLKGVQMCY
jgi:hypothetical protein